MAGREPSPFLASASDEVNAALITRWLPARRDGRLLKTDLFDEIASAGLHSVLAARAGQVCGMDVSGYTAAAASAKYPDIVASVADVRHLPFADSSFDAVVSLSTIDHFADPGDIPRALDELWRVLGSNGTLVLTLDNRSNPFVALRNALPYSFLRKLGLVSYPVGWRASPADTSPVRGHERLTGCRSDVSSPSASQRKPVRGARVQRIRPLPGSLPFLSRAA